MSIPPSGDVLSMILFGILLACVIGLIGFVAVKLGGRPRLVHYRGLKIRVNAGLPVGKVVLTDASWQPVGETEPAMLDTIALPVGCAAAWLSSKDFAALTSRNNAANRPMPAPSLQA
jgi:hypothetical protein